MDEDSARGADAVDPTAAAGDVDRASPSDRPSGDSVVAPPTATGQARSPASAVYWVTPASASTGSRTRLAAIAGVILVVLGVIAGLLFLVMLIPLGQAATTPSSYASVVVDTVAVLILFAIILALASMGYVASGIGVLRSRDWARVLGIVLSVVGGLIWLGAAILALGGPSIPGSGIDPSLAALLVALYGGLFLIHLYVVVVLAFFWRAP
jgi:hypothetical protein